jgi:DNA recombination protein RmuC
MQQQVSSISQLVNDRLKETSLALQETHKTVGDRLDSATRVFGDVHKSLGRLEETHRQICDITKDIASLQELLRAPKFRGEMGETMLGKLLEDMLPKENVALQYRFSTGNAVDAAVTVGDHLIPIDAKFPLENFKRSVEAAGEEEKKAAYRGFVRDVKNRVDEVASKYILPDEGTFDFALMYVPAEAVYYQISRDEELCGYAHARKVVFVSPNTFYAYLQAILYGLKGMTIQRDVTRVMGQLSRLQVDFHKFQEEFDLIGTHLTNASKKFGDARSRLTQLDEKIASVAHHPDDILPQ